MRPIGRWRNRWARRAALLVAFVPVMVAAWFCGAIGLWKEGRDEFKAVWRGEVE